MFYNKFTVIQACLQCFVISICIAQSRALTQFNVQSENDFFAYQKKDGAYTNGIKIEVVRAGHHRLKLRNSFFFKVANGELIYAYSLRQLMFTPNSISNLRPPKDDYPYSGSLLLQHAVSSINSSNGILIQTEYVIGCIGPFSLAAETQKEFHRLIGDPIPKGWASQFPTTIVGNINLATEKRLFSISGFAELICRSDLQLGTLSNSIGVQPYFRVGRYFDYFAHPVYQTSPPRRAFIWFLSWKPIVQYVAHDALLSGSPLPLTHDQQLQMQSGPIENLRKFSDISLTIGYSGIGLTLSYKTHSGLIKGQPLKAYGGLAFSFILND